MLEILAHLVDDHRGAVLLGFGRRRAEVRQRDDVRLAEQRGAGEIADVVLETPRPQRRDAPPPRRRPRRARNSAARRRASRPRAACSSIRPRVTGSSGTCSDTKSAWRSTSSIEFALRTDDGRRHAASTVISGSKPITFMPSLIAVSATRLPIAPRPMMPSVRCGSSRPANCFLPSSTRASRSRRGGIERRHVAKRRDDVARRHQHRGQHQLLDRVRVRARRVEHRRAALAHLGDRNVVRARARAPDRLDAGAESPSRACRASAR